MDASETGEVVQVSCSCEGEGEGEEELESSSPPGRFAQKPPQKSKSQSQEEGGGDEGVVLGGGVYMTPSDDGVEDVYPSPVSTSPCISSIQESAHGI